MNDVAVAMCSGALRVGCRRTVPHLQRLLDYLDLELTALETIHPG